MARMAWARAPHQEGVRGDSAGTEGSWSSLCLPSKLLHDIRSTVEAFAGARPLYQRMGLAYRRGLLFHGPPGNGKTLVCAAITTALQWPTIYVTADDRVDVGRELGSAFKQAADLAPVILCLEDIDALLDSSASLSAFLNRLDGCQAHEGLLVLATTNHPEKLDEALTSRPKQVRPASSTSTTRAWRSGRTTWECSSATTYR